MSKVQTMMSSSLALAGVAFWHVSILAEGLRTLNLKAVIELGEFGPTLMIKDLRG